MEARDLARLRAPFIILVLCLLMALGAGWHAVGQARMATAEESEAKRSFNDAHNRYDTARRDEALMRLTIKRFRVLEAQHMVGDESRLGWIERLREAREAAGFRRLDYELRPRRTIDMPAPGTDRFKLTASRMVMNAEALHGQRLLDFLDNLARESSALVVVRSCDVQRHNDTETTSGEFQLRARCELDWVTVAEPVGGEVAQ